MRLPTISYHILNHNRTIENRKTKLATAICNLNVRTLYICIESGTITLSLDD